MRIFAYLRSLTSTFFRRDHLDAELDEEFRTHISQQADALERSGLPRPEAERQARIAFGSPAKAIETSREQLPAFWLETFWLRSEITPSLASCVSMSACILAWLYSDWACAARDFCARTWLASATCRFL